MKTQADTTDAPIPWAAMAGIIATVTVFAVAQGLTYPLLSFILHRQGVPSGLIGLSAAMTPLGFIVSSVMIPWLTRRFGAAAVAVTCSLVAAAVLALIGWTQDVWAWMPLRFLLGFFANPLYVISETWLITIAPPARRGRIMGLYTSIVSGGFAVGPLALGVVGTEGWASFAIGVAAFVACGLTVLAVIPRLPDIPHEGEQTSVTGFVRRAPLLLFTVFVVAALESSVFSMIAVFGAGYGNPESRISALLAVFIVGNVALQIPFGRLAERIGSASTLLTCVALTLAGCVALPLLLDTLAVWPMVFVWGAAAFGVYTMAIIQLGERFSGPMLIAGNSAFSLVWGVGGIAGSPATGALMQAVGPLGLPVSLGLISGALLFALLVNRRTGRLGAAAAPR